MASTYNLPNPTSAVSDAITQIEVGGSSTNQIPNALKTTVTTLVNVLCPGDALSGGQFSTNNTVCDQILRVLGNLETLINNANARVQSIIDRLEFLQDYDSRNRLKSEAQSLVNELIQDYVCMGLKRLLRMIETATWSGSRKNFEDSIKNAIDTELNGVQNALGNPTLSSDFDTKIVETVDSETSTTIGGLVSKVFTVVTKIRSIAEGVQDLQTRVDAIQTITN